MSTLYRKYRPKTFSEISGQHHIVRTLTNAIVNGRIGQAYLLTGPRGTGKTTLARIFAKTINCLEPVKQEKKGEKTKASIEPCNKCKNCRLILEDRAIDLIEIDAASHTGVDNIRSLKESIPLPPTALKYKIYIIDEVHMLSTGAFNALLKTLEEPPAHAIFILATTELHKVPETIISRCQRFDVSNLSTDQIIERLGQIAKAEKVEIETEALETIALEAEGGMRDAESLLGQLFSLEDKKITAQEAHAILGTSPRPLVIDFASQLLKKNTALCLEKIDQLEKDGFNLRNFNKLLLVYLRNLLLLKTEAASGGGLISSLSKQQLEQAKKEIQTVDLSAIVSLIELFQKSISRFKEATIPQLPLELAVIEFSLQGKEPEKENLPASTQVQKEKAPHQESYTISPANKESIETETLKEMNPGLPASPADKHEDDREEVQDKATAPKINGQQKKTTKEAQVNTTIQYSSGPAKEFDKSLEEILDCWSDILEKVKPHNHSIAAFLKNCTPCGIKENTVYIKTKYDFYKEKLSEIENKLTVQKVIATIVGAPVLVAFVTEKECSAMNFENDKGSKENHSVLHDAMQVFGGKIIK